ncbi:pam16 domain-containing protein [Phthorimaea operculella]|nr:pam16 domain-containing protein [Phthorimaea operculella]
MAKHLAQILVIGTQIVARAFVKTVQQEIAASQQAARKASASYARTPAQNSPPGLTLQEAMQILNIDKLDTKRLEKAFDQLFRINEVSNGGSYYLQSKIFRAKERIVQEIINQNRNEVNR